MLLQVVGSSVRWSYLQRNTSWYPFFGWYLLILCELTTSKWSEFERLHILCSSLNFLTIKWCKYSTPCHLTIWLLFKSSYWCHLHLLLHSLILFYLHDPSLDDWVQKQSLSCWKNESSEQKTNLEEALESEIHKRYKRTLKLKTQTLCPVGGLLKKLKRSGCNN
jgi:hypothetical protein